MESKRPLLLPLLCVLVGHIIFGFSFLFSRRALDVSPPIFMLAARFIVSFIILNLLMLTKRFYLNLRGKRTGWLLLLGLAQPVAYFIFETYGITRASTSFAGTIIALVPVASAIGGFVVLGERVRPVQAAFTAVSVAGVYITTRGQSDGVFSWVGFALLLGAVLSATVFNVLSRKSSSEFTAFERTYVMFGLGAAVFGVWALLSLRGDYSAALVTLSSGRFWVAILYLAGASSVCAFLMINYAVAYLSVASFSIFANFTTVVSILAGVLLLGEPFRLPQIIGSCVIVASAYVVNRCGAKD